jgi:hypothetical protein
MSSAVLQQRPVERSITLSDRFAAVRAQTEGLCEPLEIEDFVVSSMVDVSPTKWHFAERRRAQPEREIEASGDQRESFLSADPLCMAM